MTDRVLASVFALYLQTNEGGAGIPWWVWLILIAVLLLLLLIGFVRQSEPGEPLPRPEERMAEPVAAAEDKVIEEVAEPELEASEVAVAAEMKAAGESAGEDKAVAAMPEGPAAPDEL